jgi:hypothetical protein
MLLLLWGTWDWLSIQCREEEKQPRMPFWLTHNWYMVSSGSKAPTFSGSAADALIWLTAFTVAWMTWRCVHGFIGIHLSLLLMSLCMCVSLSPKQPALLFRHNIGVLTDGDVVSRVIALLKGPCYRCLENWRFSYALARILIWLPVYTPYVRFS